MATSNGVASRGQHASHVLSITGVVGTAPCLEVHGVTPGKKLSPRGTPDLSSGVPRLWGRSARGRTALLGAGWAWPDPTQSSMSSSIIMR